MCLTELLYELQWDARRVWDIWILNGKTVNYKMSDPSCECQLLSLGIHSERLMFNNTVFALANRVQVTCYWHERLLCHTIFKALIFFSLLIKDTLLRTGSHNLLTQRLCILFFFSFHIFQSRCFLILYSCVLNFTWKLLSCVSRVF